MGDLLTWWYTHLKIDHYEGEWWLTVLQPDGSWQWEQVNTDG